MNRTVSRWPAYHSESFNELPLLVFLHPNDAAACNNAGKRPLAIKGETSRGNSGHNAVATRRLGQKDSAHRPREGAMLRATTAISAVITIRRILAAVSAARTLYEVSRFVACCLAAYYS